MNESNSSPEETYNIVEDPAIPNVTISHIRPLEEKPLMDSISQFWDMIGRAGQLLNLEISIPLHIKALESPEWAIVFRHAVSDVFHWIKKRNKQLLPSFKNLCSEQLEEATIYMAALNKEHGVFLRMQFHELWVYMLKILNDIANHLEDDSRLVQDLHRMNILLGRHVVLESCRNHIIKMQAMGVSNRVH